MNGGGGHDARRVRVHVHQTSLEDGEADALQVARGVGGEEVL